jgi:hypothetical protein
MIDNQTYRKMFCMKYFIIVFLLLSVFTGNTQIYKKKSTNTIVGDFDGAHSVYVVDLDGDGDMDVLGAAEDDDDIAWFENDGSQNFTEHTIESDFDAASIVYAVDLDRDGDMDVLGAAWRDDDIAWFENDGSQNFTERTIEGSFDGAYSVYAADVDGDGDIDVLGAAYFADDIAWFENDGSQNFTERTIEGDFKEASGVFAIDLDRDGDMDVLGAAEDDDDIAWFENDGSQNFTERTIEGDFDGATSVYAADVDGDGDIDVLGTAYYDDDIAWFENDGSQGFTERTIEGNLNGARLVYSIDLDRDGDMDVLAAASTDDKIAWYENNGSQVFTEHVLDGSFLSGRSVYAEDVDGDGDIDVLGASNEGDDIVWFEMESPISSIYANTIISEEIIEGSFDGAYSVYAADVDGDGDMDVLGAAWNDDDIAWFENNGSESFTMRTIDGSFLGASSVYAADVDGDGDMDVLGAAQGDNDIAWFENNGSQSFTERPIDGSFSGASSVYAADVDGDGDMDVLGAAFSDDDIAWFENDGSQGFTKRTIEGDFDGASSVYAADVDGDGDMDVLGAAKNDLDIAWFENDGSQGFTERTIDGAFWGAKSVYAADVDGDGDMDVLGAASIDDDIAWFENNGSQVFTERTIEGDFDGASSVYAVDVDGDGDMDVLGAALTDDDIAWFENDGSQGFTERTIEGDFDGAISVYAADVDGDGDMDVLGAASIDDDIAWFEFSLVPQVTGVTSTTVDGTYKLGDVIAITIAFSEVVDVTGTPQLTLETGTTDAVVDYSSGTGTNTLTFSYTIGSGETSSDLDYGSTSSLALNSGTIKDAAGNAATLTLASPGAANSLGANKALVVDGILPSVTGVNSTTGDGTYRQGEVIEITIAFSEVVNVTGTPQLTLETGTTDAVVDYSSGTGTNTLTFNYTIGSGETSSDLDYGSTSSLALNSGTIKDAALNVATLTLASPGAANSLGANRDLVVDTTVPTVTGVTSTTIDGTYKQGGAIAITIAFSKVVDVLGTPQLTLETGTTDAVVDYSSGTGTNTLTFNYTIGSGETSSDLDYGSTSALALNSGTIQDAALIAATLTLASPGTANSLGANKALVIDTTVPTVTGVTSITVDGTYKQGDVIEITVAFSEVVNVTGTPQLTLETGTTDAVVDYSSGSGTNTLTFNYTIGSGETSSDLDYGSTSSLALNSGTIKDAALNAATLTLAVPLAANSLAANEALVVDGILPTVTDVTSTTVDGIYKQGDVIAVTVAFSEVVNVTGTPQLTLETGTTDALVDYSSGTGTNTLTFSYTIGLGGTSSDLDYGSTSALALNSGTIKDAALNVATLTLASPGAANSLGANKALVVDTTVPVISSVSPSASSFIKVADVGYTLSEVIASGSVTYTRTLGSADSGSPHTQSLSGVELNTGARLLGALNSPPTLINGTVYTVAFNATDAAGNTATQVSVTGVTFDTTVPTVTGVTSTTVDGTYKQGDVIAITVAFSEVVNVTGTPQLTLETGTNDAVVDYSSGTGTNTLTFSYTIGSGETSSDLDYGSTSALVLNSGTIKDAALNAATLTLASPGAANSLAANKALVVDGILPTMTIGATNGTDAVSDGATSNDETLTITFTSSDPTVDFTAEDITVTGGVISGFAAASSTVYTAVFTPSSERSTTIGVAAGVFTDAAGNNNTAAIQFNWTYDENIVPIVLDATFILAENSANGTVLGTIEASDADGDTLTYSIRSGNTNAAFGLDASTGSLVVSNHLALDFETISTFSLLVQVSDGVLSDSATITINLTDVEEGSITNEPPTIPSTIYNLAARFLLLENSTNGTVLGTIEATDPDGDTLTYSIERGNDGEPFSLDSESGVLTLSNSSVLDYKTTPTFILFVKASDGWLSDYAFVTINLDKVMTLSISMPVISIYPNPTEGIVNIEMSEFKEATVYTLSGKRLLRSKVKSIDISALSEGVYLIKLEDRNGASVYTRLVKE